MEMDDSMYQPGAIEMGSTDQKRAGERKPNQIANTRVEMAFDACCEGDMPFRLRQES